MMDFENPLCSLNSCWVINNILSSSIIKKKKKKPLSDLLLRELFAMSSKYREADLIVETGELSIKLIFFPEGAILNLFLT